MRTYLLFVYTISYAERPQEAVYRLYEVISYDFLPPSSEVKEAIPLKSSIKRIVMCGKILNK